MRRPLSQKLVFFGTVLAAGVVATGCVPPAQPQPPTTTQVPPPPLPNFVEQATWWMDENGGRTMVDALSPAQDGAIGPEIRLGGGTYEFPGWVNNVDPTGGLVGVVSDTGGEIVVADPTHRLEPKNGIFSVSGTVRARLTPLGTLPNGGPGSSFNVVQKAHAPNTGGYWKVEVNASGLQRKGKILCTVGDGKGEISAPSSVRVDDGNWHTFRCWLAQNKLVAEVDGQQAAVDASTIDTVHPVGKFSNEVVVGKKPGSTDPWDSFSGWLGELHIATG